MKKYFIISLLLLLGCLYANAQDIQIRAQQPKQESTELDLTAYDGRTPFFDLQLLHKHPHYYDGHKILFLPNASNNYGFYSDFKLIEPVSCPEVNDTIWNRSHTKIKRIDTPILDIYKPAKVEAGKIRTYEYPRYSGSGEVNTLSGFFTPKEMIEGRAFTILSSTSETVEEVIIGPVHVTYFEIILQNSDGEKLKWRFSANLFGGKYVFMPIIMNEYLDSYRDYVGKTYVYDDKSYVPTSAKEYECTEISYIPDNLIYDSNSEIGYFYSPVLFFKCDGKEVQYNVLPEKHYGYLRSRASISTSTFDKLVEKSRYDILLAAAEEARVQRAKADSLAKVERAAQLQREEEERLAQEAARYKELKRKYGKANADLIVNGEVRLGWSKEMCRESWGEPNDINTSIGAWGTHEQWVYYSSYLYFENGKLTSIQL